MGVFELYTKNDPGDTALIELGPCPGEGFAASLAVTNSRCYTTCANLTPEQCEALASELLARAFNVKQDQVGRHYQCGCPVVSPAYHYCPIHGRPCLAPRES